MASVNKVILIGNLGADPESRVTPGGLTIATLRIATSGREKDKDGNWCDATEWHRVVCFGNTAENAKKFLAKGRQVFVEGKIRTNKWKDDAGNDRYTTEIVADEVRFLGGPGGTSEGGRSEGGGARGGNSANNGGRSGGGSRGGGGYGGRPDSGGGADTAFGDTSGGSGGDDDIPF